MVNIWGLKKKIKQCKEELKKGQQNLGRKKYRKLESRIYYYKKEIKKLREQRKGKKKRLKRRKK